MINGSYYSNVTKVANSIRKSKNLAGKEVKIKVEKDKEGNDIYVVLLISNNLSNFDMDVADAIYTMYKKKKAIITPTGVLRILSGDDTQALKKGYNKKAIIESIEKLRNTTIDIECKQQMENRGETIEYFGGYSFLHVDDYTIGEKYKINYYKKKEMVDRNTYYEEFFMPLYGYMEVLRHAIGFPPNILDVKGYLEGKNSEVKFTNSIENIQIKRYLIRRLEIKRRRMNGKIDEKSEEKIVYYYHSHKKDGGEEGMFSQLDIQETNYATKDSWKHKRQNVHNKVIQILEVYKEMGYIQNYDIYKTSKGMFYGVVIVGSIQNPHELTII